MSYAIKPSLLVEEETNFALSRREMCTLSVAWTDLRISDSRRRPLFGLSCLSGLSGFLAERNYQMNQTDRACLDVLPKLWSMRVTPLFPNPLPVCLFAGPQARSSVRRLPHQLARSMQVKCRVGDCSGKPHPAVTVGSQQRAAFRPIRIENGSGRVPVGIMAACRKYGILGTQRCQPITIQRTHRPVMRHLEDLNRTVRR